MILETRDNVWEQINVLVYVDDHTTFESTYNEQWSKEI